MQEVIDIIIKSWNVPEKTLFAVESIKKCTEIPHRIIIVDDGSTKEVLSLLKKEKDVLLVEHGKNRGTAEVAITGFQHSRSRIGILMDNDITVPQKWLSKMLPYFSDPKVGLVAPLKIHPKYRYPGTDKSTKEIWEETTKENLPIRESLKIFLRGEGLDGFRKKLVFHNKITDQVVQAPPGFVSSCCIAFDRKKVEEAGGIARKEFRHYGVEDVDLCWRLGKKGYKIVKTSKVYVHHFEHSSINANRLDYKKILMRNNKLLFDLWGKEVLMMEKEMLKKRSAKEIMQDYPFIPVFKKIKHHGIVDAF